MKNKVETKDAYLLYAGIILGAVLGVFGNVYADYFYETSKDEWWFTGTVIGVAVVFFTFLIIMMILVIRWGIQIKKASEEKKREETKGSNQIDAEEKANTQPTHDQIRMAILTFLYKKAEKSSNDAVVGLSELYSVLNLEEDVVQFDLRYLQQEGLIECVVLLNNYCSIETGPIRITSSGINVIDHKEENKIRHPFLSATIPIHIENKIGINL